MKRNLRCGKLAAAVMLAISGMAWGQITDNPAGGRPIAGIPVNYVEAKSGSHALPDVLKMFDGTPVTDAAMWTEKRRPEILKYIESEVYGKIPATAPKVTWVVVSTDPNALEGKAIQKVLEGRMGEGPDAPVINVTLHTPKDAQGPVPVLTALGFNFGGARGGARRGGPATGPAAGVAVAPATAPARAGRGAGGAGRGPAGPPRGTPAELISRGYGHASVNYSSIETDQEGGINISRARKLALRSGEEKPAADEWGTIASWAWGLSRLMDYYETDSSVDAKRIAITGTSRLGKTVTWAGANDQRIALVIACCGGEGGAALARRNYGETVAHLVAPSRYPYQFAANYQKYAADPSTLKTDTHCLVALMAPRPILLSTGRTDGWSDPYGEFLAGVAATPVYKLLGKTGIDNASYISGSAEMVGGDLSFLMTNGGHGSSDWDLWLQFMDTHLKPAK